MTSGWSLAIALPLHCGDRLIDLLVEGRSPEDVGELVVGEVLGDGEEVGGGEGAFAVVGLLGGAAGVVVK
jgi:hypothetical protein